MFHVEHIRENIMIELGIVTFVTFWLLWVKLPWETRFKLLGHPFWFDIAVTAGLMILFGGTGEGLAAATLAAMTFSICINLARRTFGYYQKIDGDQYYFAGKINMSNKIIEEKRRKLCQK